MITLTESRIELADRHSSLFYYRLPAAGTTGPLPMWPDEKYDDLYSRIDTPQRVEYHDITGSEGTIIECMKPAYRNNKYWRKFLQSDRTAFHQLAAERFLPIEARLKDRIEYVNDPAVTFKVALIPRVLLYPFGWSTWISLLVTGDHTITDLAEFIRAVFKQKIFKLGGDPAPVSLRAALDFVAKGVRADAFGKEQTRDMDSQEVMSIITVLGKHGGSPSPKGLSDPEKERMLLLVQPDNPAPRGALEQRVYQLREHQDLNYIIHHDLGRFIWLEDLLPPEDRNHDHLECYHFNTFRSLLHAWHLHGLLDLLTTMKQPSSEIYDAVERACRDLKSPSFRDASLREYLKRPEVQAIIATAENFKEKDASA